jgi:hypothetical protein
VNCWVLCVVLVAGRRNIPILRLVELAIPLFYGSNPSSSYPPNLRYGAIFCVADATAAFDSWGMKAAVTDAPGTEALMSRLPTVNS